MVRGPQAEESPVCIIKKSAAGGLPQDIWLGAVTLNQKLEPYKTDSHTFKELKVLQDTDLKVSIGYTAHAAGELWTQSLSLCYLIFFLNCLDEENNGLFAGDKDDRWFINGTCHQRTCHQLNAVWTVWPADWERMCCLGLLSANFRHLHLSKPRRFLL